MVWGVQGVNGQWHNHVALWHNHALQIRIACPTRDRDPSYSSLCSTWWLLESRSCYGGCGLLVAFILFIPPPPKPPLCTVFFVNCYVGVFAGHLHNKISIQGHMAHIWGASEGFIQVFFFFLILRGDSFSFMVKSLLSHFISTILSYVCLCLVQCSLCLNYPAISGLAVVVFSHFSVIWRTPGWPRACFRHTLKLKFGLQSHFLGHPANYDFADWELLYVSCRLGTV